MMSNFVSIDNSTIVCTRNIITTNITIENHIIVNLNCTIGYDAILKNCITILPSSNISGYVIIEEKATIETGTAIIQGINTGKQCMIGTGSVVNKTILDYSTAVGVLAKVIKAREKEV